VTAVLPERDVHRRVAIEAHDLIGDEAFANAWAEGRMRDLVALRAAVTEIIELAKSR
jgi:hypothetical protein